jgi:hypothetical protein
MAARNDNGRANCDDENPLQSQQQIVDEPLLQRPNCRCH